MFFRHGHAAFFMVPLLCTLTAGLLMADRAHSLEAFLKAPPRWSTGDIDARYQPEDLHEYMNGGAERYLGYGFRELRVREHLSPNCPYRVLVELYRMDSPADAFGVFSSDRGSGEPASGTGVNAVINPWLLQFWQDRYFVRIQDSMAGGSISDTLLAFGRLISSALPKGDEAQIPEIALKLPREGLIESSLCFFRSFNSLNSFIYLGEENILGLGPEVEAVTAEYRLMEKDSYGRLLLVRYPDDASGTDAFRRFAAARDKLPARVAKSLSRLVVRGRLFLLLFDENDSDWSDRMESMLWNAFDK